MGGRPRAVGRRRLWPEVLHFAARARLESQAVASPGAGPEEAQMFTGIVEDLGEVQAVEQLGDFARIHVLSEVVTADARLGDSICVNGVCLTVTALLGAPPPGEHQEAAPQGLSGPPAGFIADVMGETLARSSLKEAVPGTQVNLERSVRLAD